MPERYENFIGGKWTAPESGIYLPDLNPADTRDIVGEFPNSTSADALTALEAAYRSAKDWAALAGPTRGEFLRKAADILAARADEVAADLMREEGKSLPEAKGETLARRGAPAVLCGGNHAARWRGYPFGERGDLADDKAGSAWRGFLDYALEFPDCDSAVESGARAGVRQYRCDEAVGTRPENRVEYRKSF